MRRPVTVAVAVLAVAAVSCVLVLNRRQLRDQAVVQVDAADAA